MSKIRCQYFLTKELGAKLLHVKTIRDVYLLNLISEFSEEKLLSAFEAQLELSDLYRNSFIKDYYSKHKIDDEGWFDMKKHEDKFGEYLIGKLD